jgi:ATP-dependent Clp protease ATP-binding subunit ClpC
LGFSAETSDAVEYERMKDSVRQALERTFPPEFLNRIDEIITFGRLTEKDLTEIAARMLAEVTKRIAALGITIRFSGEVAQNLARAVGKGAVYMPDSLAADYIMSKTDGAIILMGAGDVTEIKRQLTR